MAERKVSWKPRKENVLIGTRIQRLDGVEKSSGYAKYAADMNTPGTLFAKVLTCKHAHARIKKLDVEPARKLPGVHAVLALKDAGDKSECRWDGELVAAVAAERLDQADDALRAIEVQYEVLPHVVDDYDLAAAEKAKVTKELRNRTSDKFEEALKSAKVVHTGDYGVRTISHACMEPHGSHCEWVGDDKLNVYLSTQNVSGTGGQFAGMLGIDQANVTVRCDYVGGGFGSKFGADEWGIACAQLAKQAGRPVRLILDRPTELKAAGIRPSAFGKITIAGDAEGKIVAWDSEHWGSGGFTGTTVPDTVVPYNFNIPNKRQKVTNIVTNCGPQRAWRAPNHPQGCALTGTAIDDLAAKLGMDSYDVYLKNLDKTQRPAVYAAEMAIGAKLIDWKAKWHPHGKGPGGAVKQGLGMALHTWAGRAGNGKCIVKLHPDGTAESYSGSQDLGTGTRTVIGITVAETFGIPLSSVKVNIGTSAYPQANPSGGSTTVGGVSGPNRRAALEALWKVFDLVAARYQVDGTALVAKDQKIFSGDKEVCTWKQACSLIGPMPLEIQGSGAANDGLTSQQVGGVHMADVSVDIETGKIRVNKFVAVQDCGLIIDLLTAESQVYGALIMSIAYALMEERIMDNRTGRYINCDFENYKLTRIGDIGELVVEMYQPDDEYNRGVIGLGEPPVISGGAALSNAVANAIGVRVPMLPMIPQRVIDALKGAKA